MTQPAPQPDPEEQHLDGSRPVKWHKRVFGLCFALFAIELGIFLVVFPWLPSWDLNWVPLQSPGMRMIWMNPYFRGALTGLGLVNLYVGFEEFLRQVRSLFQ
jgi:hypothetical protein